MGEKLSLVAGQYQFGTVSNKQYIEFTGRLSKNMTCDVDSKAKPKIIRQYADPSHPRCAVDIFKSYIDIIKRGRFYRRALDNGPNGEIRFSIQHVGINKLQTYMATMYKAEGIYYECKSTSFLIYIC